MNQRRGYLSGLTAYAVWGFFPVYFHYLLPASAAEILSHRVLWSVVTVAVILTAMKRWRYLRPLVRRPRTLAGVGLAAALIGTNWFVYIYGVNSDQVIETSLGYFVTPLISVLFGVVVFKERMRPAQWTAVGIGTVAVVVITADYGRLPWIALTLAASFGSYGLVKKRLGLPPADGLFVESAALALPAAICLGVLTADGRSTFTTVSTSHTLLLVAAGAITAIPLLLFADAANRIPMTGLGIIQYAAPILQLGCGLVFFHEPMPQAELIGFGLVWIALVIFTADAIRHARRTRATVSTPAAVPIEQELAAADRQPTS